MFEGSWFGEAIFDSYLRERKLALLTQPALDRLYRDWGSGSVSLSLAEISAVKILVVLLLLLGLAAHVFYKPGVAKALKTVEGRRLPVRLYLRGYHFFTLGFFLLLVCLFVLWPVKFGLVALAILIVVPGTVYLLLYSRDIVQGTYLERLVYFCLFVFLLQALLGWPYLYGRRAFQPEFYLVHIPGAEPDHCDPAKLLKGPSFLAYEDEREKRKLFFRVCFEQDGDKLLDFFEYPGTYRVVGKESLSKVLADFVPPVSSSEAARALSEAQKQLGAMLP